MEAMTAHFSGHAPVPRNFRVDTLLFQLMYLADGRGVEVHCLHKDGSNNCTVIVRPGDADPAYRLAEGWLVSSSNHSIKAALAQAKLELRQYLKELKHD